jgi:hypothetical protein
MIFSYFEHFSYCEEVEGGGVIKTRPTKKPEDGPWWAALRRLD